MRRLLWPFLFAASSFAAADDAAWTYVGGAGNFTHNKQIRMVSERVNIDLQNKKSHFHAEFLFCNEGRATTVTMAFPEEHHNYPSGRPAIERFRSTVDGHPVKVRRERLPASKAQYYSEYVAAWLKKVSFAAHESKRVTVDYWAKNGDIGDFVQNTYVLRSGSTWKGPIGKAELVVDWSGLDADTEPNLTWDRDEHRWTPPADVKSKPLSPKRVMVVRRNFEPDANLHITWDKVELNLWLNGKRLPNPSPRLTASEGLSGPNSDPTIQLKWASLLLRSAVDETEIDPNTLPKERNFAVGHRTTVSIKAPNELLINGHRAQLRRAIHKGSVYVRDLIRALGGSVRYDPRWQRLYLHL